MLKLLIDTNVILDLILERGQPGINAGHLLSAIEQHRARGFIAAHSLTTLHYVTARASGTAMAQLAVTYTLQLLAVVPLTTNDFHAAIALDMADFEDSVQSAAALAVRADYIVTSNKKDFRKSPVPPRSAAEALPLVLSL